MNDDRIVDLDDDDLIVGPVVRPANRSLDASGSIHDDATAADLGFRGGTVAGNIHLDHFGPLLVARFGEHWFEQGWISMYFRSPTTHLEPVRAVLGSADRGDTQGPAWVVTPDGNVVSVGDAGVGTTAATALDGRERRPIDDPSKLSILDQLLIGELVGQVIDAGTTSVDMDRQRRLLQDPSLLTSPIDWYRESSPWGAPVACASVTVDTLWAPFERQLRGHVRPAVGLYGAIELRHLGGPLLAGVDYHLDGVVETISQTPKTEVFWARTTARLDERPIASLTMMIRLLTGSAQR